MHVLIVNVFTADFEEKISKTFPSFFSNGKWDYWFKILFNEVQVGNVKIAVILWSLDKYERLAVFKRWSELPDKKSGVNSNGFKFELHAPLLSRNEVSTLEGSIDERTFRVWAQNLGKFFKGGSSEIPSLLNKDT